MAKYLQMLTFLIYIMPYPFESWCVCWLNFCYIQQNKRGHIYLKGSLKYFSSSLWDPFSMVKHIPVALDCQAEAKTKHNESRGELCLYTFSSLILPVLLAHEMMLLTCRIDFLPSVCSVCKIYHINTRGASAML